MKGESLAPSILKVFCCFIIIFQIAAAADGDKYRDYLTEEDLKNTEWIDGPPNFDAVNKLFEEGRTNVWPVGSLEEKVQRLVKTWDMEIVHKANPKDYKTLDADKFVIWMNGKRSYTLKQVGEVGGSYNVFLQTSLPAPLRVFNPDEESYNSSQSTFKTTFSRGFAIEVLQVYSGAPIITFKFRHWGYMEGPFKGHAPTGELVEMFGMSSWKLDENSKVVKVEFFYERGELLAGLIEGETSDGSAGPTGLFSSCPFMA